MNKCKNCTCENGIKRCVKNGVVSEEVLSGWVSVGDFDNKPKLEIEFYDENNQHGRRSKYLLFITGQCEYLTGYYFSHDGVSYYWAANLGFESITHWMEIPEPPK